MGEEGVIGKASVWKSQGASTRFLLRSIGFVFLSYFGFSFAIFILSQIYLRSMHSGFRTDLEIKTLHRPKHGPQTPPRFSGACLRTQFSPLLGKRLTFYPSNAGVIEYGDRLIANNPGTYIRLNKNKIVTEIFCVVRN